MRLARQSKPLLLVARLADLERDADGDGLTDVLERRILTDPEARDTDGDGIDDGADPLPLVPATEATRAGDPLQDLLAGWTVRPPSWTGDEQGTRTPIAEGDALPPSVLPPAARGDEVLFLVGRRADFGGLRANRRVIVLSPEELRAAQKRFGAFHPLRIPVLLRSPEGDRVYVEWNSQWMGGAELLRRDGEGWVAEWQSGWIT